MKIKPFAPAQDYEYIERISNYLFDYIMPTLTGNQFKVLCFIYRKTVGWAKDRDSISQSQIEEGTKIGSHNTIERAINKLEELGYITKIIGQGRSPNTYCLNLDFELDTRSTSEIDVQGDDVVRQKLTQDDSSTSKTDVYIKYSTSKIDVQKPKKSRSTSKIDDTKDVILINTDGEPKIDVQPFEVLYQRWVADLGEFKTQREREMFGDYYNDNPLWCERALDETIIHKPDGNRFAYFKRIIDGWFKLGHIPEREPATPPQKGKQYGSTNNGQSARASPVQLTPAKLARLKELEQDGITEAAGVRGRDSPAG